MVEANNYKSSQSTDDSRNISELFYLLNFFSQIPGEQWDAVPKDFAPVWVETFSIHCNVYNPIFFLTCMLMRIIEEMLYNSYGFKEETIRILEDEIHSLLAFWITEYNNIIFEEEGGITGPGQIWLVLARLCQIALSFEDWSRYEIQKLSFEYFVENHSYPYDPV
ncbi:hypothetical protein BCD64_26410 [Nostoc sp. MBR 210]|nr:hypothetical protein BCD64_26410 [Nostoc sp. MBR 210]